MPLPTGNHFVYISSPLLAVFSFFQLLFTPSSNVYADKKSFNVLLEISLPELMGLKVVTSSITSQKLNEGKIFEVFLSSKTVKNEE
ncbi:hypothetical protein JYT29_00640 [Nitrospina gracilis]|nr:hypothetical protein [Nitrospina gracilis]